MYQSVSQVSEVSEREGDRLERQSSEIVADKEEKLGQPAITYSRLGSYLGPVPKTLF
jgi:hypothetical protein